MKRKVISFIYVVGVMAISCGSKQASTKNQTTFVNLKFLECLDSNSVYYGKVNSGTLSSEILPMADCYVNGNTYELIWKLNAPKSVRLKMTVDDVKSVFLSSQKTGFDNYEIFALLIPLVSDIDEHEEVNIKFPASYELLVRNQISNEWDRIRQGTLLSFEKYCELKLEILK